jgi:hypothetical protein
MLDRVRRVPKAALLVAALGVALGAIGLAALLRGPEHSEDLVTTRDVARRLKQEAQRQRIPVYRVRCVRVDHLLGPSIASRRAQMTSTWLIASRSAQTGGLSYGRLRNDPTEATIIAVSDHRRRSMRAWIH